jgi:Xaa-Pro aminopeptidase
MLSVMAIEAEEYADRPERLAALLDERGVDAIFVPLSSDLEYLTGLERDLPSLGTYFTRTGDGRAFPAQGRSRSSCCRGCIGSASATSAVASSL